MQAIGCLLNRGAVFGERAIHSKGSLDANQPDQGSQLRSIAVVTSRFRRGFADPHAKAHGSGRGVEGTAITGAVEPAGSTSPQS